ncbi:MAG: type II secretion system F family protein [Planctomycetota bacterium]|nr:type II secretion system F family protein [Planctomycetota bacterium]MDG2143966.1 type II secretion system F family protein [Planctomycetota bacterium]
MPIYEYKAFAAGGASTTGVIDADTPRAARDKLRREKILVTELKQIRGRKGKGESAEKPDRVSFLEKINSMRTAPQGPRGRDIEVVGGITRQLGTLLAAGIPLAEALRALVDQADNRKHETMFRELREDITTGTSLGDSLAKHPYMFSDLYVNMVKAGEASGHVDSVLSRLADFLQSQRALSRKISSALMYPLLMVGLGVVVVGILLTVVVPKITGMLEDSGQELPFPTKVLVTTSELFQNWWWVGCLLIGLISYLVERFYKTENGKLKIDSSLLKLPVLGDMLQKGSVSRFTRTLSTLLTSGVPAVRSLEITESVVGNQVVANATKHIRTRILEGTDIATPLKQTNAFPSVVGYMVAVGEQSGELENMLDRIADAYDEELEVVTERVTALLEPLMIISLSLVVGFIVYAIVLPILQVSSF